MSKSIVTKYSQICAFCGRNVEAEHHLVFGTADREISEQDGVKLPICNNCHNMGDKISRIHDNIMAEKLSKMLGQLAWEKQWLLEQIEQSPEEREALSDRARKEFMKRYRKSFL